MHAGRVLACNHEPTMCVDTAAASDGETPFRRAGAGALPAPFIMNLVTPCSPMASTFGHRKDTRGSARTRRPLDRSLTLNCFPDPDSHLHHGLELPAVGDSKSAFVWEVRDFNSSSSLARSCVETSIDFYSYVLGRLRTVHKTRIPHELGSTT